MQLIPDELRMTYVHMPSQRAMYVKEKANSCENENNRLVRVWLYTSEPSSLGFPVTSTDDGSLPAG